MNKNLFLICLIGLLVISYIISKFYLLTKIKSNENFDTTTINVDENTSNINSELLDLLKSKIESEIDQITESEIKTETETEMIYILNAGGWITVVVIIILIFCCSSCIMSIFTPSIPSTQPAQPVHPVHPIVYQYPPPPNPYSYPPPNPYS